jgi:hypothetical protein
MSLAFENIDQKQKEKKENYFLPFLNFIRSTLPRQSLPCIPCLPAQNSRTLWNKTLSHTAIGKKN